MLRCAAVLAALLPGLIIACAGGSQSTDTVRDSAGVLIVESSAPAWEAERRWTLAPHPALDIGGSSTDSHYDLDEVAAAVRLRDGRIAVMDNGASNLKFYDSAGAWLGTTGREGDGPGEFRRVASIQVDPGDTLYPYDYQLRRVDRIAPDGRFLPSMPILASGGKLGLQPFGRFPDGSWAASAQLFSPPGDGGANRDTVVVLHLSQSLQEVDDTVGRFPSDEFFAQMVGEGADRSARLMPVPMGLSTDLSVRDSFVVVGDPARYEIREYRSDGRLVHIYRRPVGREPLSRGDFERWKHDVLAGVDERGKERLEAAWKVAPVPSLKPAFGNLHTDPDGNLWVEDGKVVRADPGTVRVFGTDGRLLGDLALPPGFEIMQVGRDYVLGVWRDDVDLEHVRLYRLRKP